MAKFLRKNIQLMQCLGVVWIDGRGIASELHRAYCAFVFFVLGIGLLLSEVVFVIDNANDFAALTSTLSFFFSHFGGFVKLTLVKICSDRIDELIVIAETSGYFVRDSELARRLDDNGRRLILQHRFVLMGSITVAVFTSVVKVVVSSDRELPYPTWFPFDYSVSPLFELTILCQAICFAFYGYCIVSVDVLLCSLMYFVETQLRLLNEKIAKLESENSWPRLVDCVRHHRRVIRFYEDVENMSSTLILQQFLTSLVVICFTMYQMTYISFREHPSPVLASAMYLAVVCYELGMYCWHGDGVRAQSDIVSRAAYSWDWPAADLKARKGLLMLTMRTRKSLIFTAGKFAPVTLEQFLAILQGSYSYYAILRRSNEVRAVQA